ncbi:Ldh family oxidoreductase [Plectonema radiosum NIES-515]|uniref:Ldh family oxidoreductase n=1 Tax=Plectonema radiosum NIES-515 TaxID=2986073 RepID=A0ABT3AV96_9CYAN|nr:Ldh family oxidoreductase [Plectonema radiosum]MCV3213052.1 Ldh family oxidoreductase [Plectonema radiosum NIES-515]
MDELAPRYRAELLHTWVTQLFENLSIPPDDAQIIADTLIEANLRGVDSHGIAQLTIYVRDIQQGQTNIHPNILVVTETPATALIDGDNGFGMVVSVRAMHEAIKRARQCGIAGVGVRQSTHFGAASYYTMMAANEGMIGLAFTNVMPYMAPWGGKSRLLGNNPLSIAVPGGIEGGVVLDMATSKVAWSKMYLLSHAGQKMPLDWALDQDGQPTEDPNEGMAGLMLPVGEHKGYGLALMVQMLSAVLTGAAFDHHIVNWQNIGHFFVAIDVNSFIPYKGFCERVSQLVADLHQSKPLKEGQPIYVPGEIEAQTKQQRLATGIPIEANVVAKLTQLGKEFCVPFPQLTE